jgi:uncharacterized membrane protein YcfT
MVTDQEAVTSSPDTRRSDVLRGILGTSGGGVVGAGRPTAGRVEWVDALKGAAIVLVVLTHTLPMLDSLELGSTPWHRIDSLLQTVRMPLFFTAAGLFAAKWLTASWTDLIGRKLRFYAYLYLLWSVIYFAVTVALPIPRGVFGIIDEWEELAIAPVVPLTALWFLYALAGYVVVLRATRACHPAIVLGAASVFFTLVTDVLEAHYPELVTARTLLWTRIVKYALFFLLGARLRTQLVSIADRTRLRHLLVGVPALLVLAPPLGAEDVPGTELVASVVALYCSTTVAVAAAGSRVGRLTASLGRTTLPVFLLHVPVLLVAFAVIQALDPVIEGPVRALLPPALCVATVSCALAIHRLTRAVPALYDVPASMQKQRRATA